MNTRFSKVALVGGVAAAALAVGTFSASAVTATYTVKAGSAPSGTKVAITGTTTGSSPQISFMDTTAGIPLTCASGTAPGSTTVGTGLSGTKLGTITGTGTKFNGCAGPFGLQFVVTGKGTWSINASGATSGGTTKGTITAIQAHVADGSSCVFDVTGTVAGSFVNGTSTSTLSLPGTTSQLTLKNVTGTLCASAGIKNGDKASFKASYSIKATTAAYNPVTVTSS